MNEIYAYQTGLDATRNLAHSALPNAPVIAETERPTIRTRSRTAAWLHSVANATHHLANRVDPVCAAR